jgi:hypothetical protein
VAGGNELEALLRVLGRLRAELVEAAGEEQVGRREGSAVDAGKGSVLCGLAEEEETLVVAIRRALEKLVAAVGPGQHRIEQGDDVDATLDFVELVIRGELIRSQEEALSPLMPSIVFLVTLPAAGQDEALELSRRTRELIAAILGR